MAPEARPSKKPTALQTTVYLDCNATTHTHPVALQAAQEAMDLCYGNPSSTHITGLHAKSFLESARDAAARAVGAEHSEEIIFNSGATEGIQSTALSVLNHLAAEFRESGRLRRWRILYGATEHKAVPAALNHWAELLHLPVEIEAIPVDHDGILDLTFISRQLHETALICTMAVNNETGVIQPLAKITELLRSNSGKDCLWFIDGVQALGKINLRLTDLAAHYACFSGHKLNAPKGIGFLWVRHDAPFTPMIVGGGQERGKRSGTENLPGAAAFGRILRALNEDDHSIFLSHEQLESCRKKLIETLSRCFPTLVWNANLNKAVPTTLNFSVEGISGRELMNAFDAVGVRVSGGSACSSGKNSGSHVLTAMHLPRWRSENAIRLSFGPANTISEIDTACRAIGQAGEALRANCMIPNLPARAGQQGDLINTQEPGISELRSSDGTRAWLVIGADKSPFLVADCERALSELNHKLICRGLNGTTILRLDVISKAAEQIPLGWEQFNTDSGLSWLWTPQARSGTHTSSADVAVLFCAVGACLEELAQSPHASKLTARPLLACLACEPTPLSAYRFSAAGLHNIGTAIGLDKPADPKLIECSKVELNRLLSEGHFTVFDVREPFESASSHLDKILGTLMEQSEEVPTHEQPSGRFQIQPLSRLPQFISERLAAPRPEKILCVCRSGQRSFQAAELLRRLAGCEAFSLRGGLADLLAPNISMPPRGLAAHVDES